MITLRSFVAISLLVVSFPTHGKSPETAIVEEMNANTKRIELSYNVLDTLLIHSLKQTLFSDIDLTYLPFHFDLHIASDRKWGWNFGAVYRFESYHEPEDTPLVDEWGYVNSGKVWTDHHEVFLLAGLFYNSAGSAQLTGTQYSLKIGPGFGFSPVYNYSSVVVKGDIAYVHTLSEHLSIRAGGGLIVNHILHESSPVLDFGDLTFFPGILIHRIIPVLNVSLGYQF